MELFVLMDIAANKQIGISGTLDGAKKLIKSSFPKACWNGIYKGTVSKKFKNNHLQGEWIAETSNCLEGFIHNEWGRFAIFKFKLKS